ncbi:MAG: DUF5916 domain-containing protein [Gemmatimonadaceae bacterium]
MHRFSTLVACIGVAAASAHAQQLQQRAANGALSTSATTTAQASRATAPIDIDGRAQDDVWQSAQVIEGFRVFDPVENGEPTMRTEARVAFDENNVYVLVRSFDPEPSKIMALLSRRDERTQSDWIRVIIDSYHDKRSGFEFMVNPAGVKRDMLLYNDGNEDLGWDAVWDVKTSIDSFGWLAEFRIPLNQLRYPKRDSHTFGFGIQREIGRLNERQAWPLFSRSKSGIASQLGDLHGIQGISSPRRLEVLPYAVTSNETLLKSNGWGRDNRITAGADIKYGLTSNLTLDATVNPDFGQVEADPSVLNLSAFEQFFEERRPFFLEGSGIFRYDMQCNDGRCTGLFYSRRIGRSPQLGFMSDDPNAVPPATTILGATKITGRLSNGLSLGVLDAVTDREFGGGAELEPRTNYFAARLNHEMRGGQTALGGMLTTVNRDLAPESEPFLRRSAYAGGVDFRHQFAKQNYELAGYAAASVVQGSEQAIARTQMSSVHYYQRPDDDLEFDSTRTALSGYTGQVSLNKRGGGPWRFWMGGWYRSAGLEINDLGFMTNVNNMGVSIWHALMLNTPKAFYRRFQVNLNASHSWTTEGLSTGPGGNINWNTQLKNMWHMGSGIGVEGHGVCGACTRGGPFVRDSKSAFGWWWVEGDSRKRIFPGFNANFGRSDDGRSSFAAVGGRINMRVASRFSASLGAGYNRNIDDNQWYGNFGAALSDTTHYTFARLDQKTVSMTGRLNYTVTPTLSVQFYGQPFVSAGDYTDWRELNEGRAERYDGRYKSFTNQGNLQGFNFKQFRSNSVVRWEYRPGSTLFFVWQQGRTEDNTYPGTFNFRRDYRTLFGAHPQNTFLIKGSYWLSL